MRKTIRIATFVALPLMLATTLNAQNLLADGIGAEKAGFEVENLAVKGGAAGWITKQDGIFERSLEKSNTGKASLKINVPADELSLDKVDINSDIFTVERGQKYKVVCSIFVDAEKSKRLNSVQLNFSYGKWMATTIKANNIKKGEWTQIESDVYTVPADNKGNKFKVTLRTFLNTTYKGKLDKEVLYYIDDVQVVEVQ